MQLCPAEFRNTVFLNTYEQFCLIMSAGHLLDLVMYHFSSYFSLTDQSVQRVLGERPVNVHQAIGFSIIVLNVVRSLLKRQFYFNLTHLYQIGIRETCANHSSFFCLNIRQNFHFILFLDVSRWVTSGSLFSNSTYFCSGQPVHAYNYYF